MLTLTKRDLRHTVPLIALLVSRSTANSAESAIKCFVPRRLFSLMPFMSAYVLFSGPSLHISWSHRNERAYLSGIGIYMLGNVFLAHTKPGDGEAVGLIINIAALLVLVIGLLPIPPGLSVWWYILGTGTINICDQRVFMMQYG